MEFIDFEDMKAGKWTIVQARAQSYKDKTYTDLTLYKEYSSGREEYSSPLFETKTEAKRYIEDRILAPLKTFLTEDGYKFYLENNKFFPVRLENYTK